MAQKREVVCRNNSLDDFICLQDVLCSFNNSISEEQAWAVCYQCAQYCEQNSTQECFRDVYYYGLNAIRISKEGDLKIDVNFSQGTGKGPPGSGKRSSFSLSKEFKSVLTQTDVIQALGTAIYKALDFGLSESEEPHLSQDLEALIEYLTDHPADDDEGIDIERDSDADLDQDGDGDGTDSGKGESVFQDIIDSCTRRLSSGQNAQLHYKAVCRALATESTELLTFLDNIKRGHEKLSRKDEEGEPSVDDLERSDWARLWVQIMRDLRHGVRLKKVEQVHLLPLEFELTPFEILLEDIRLGRYKLNRIKVNGDIPPRVKNDAHAVILDFIRSRPPLKPANQRKLKELPVREMDSREKLLLDIRENPVNLKHVEMGKLVVRKPRMSTCDTSSDEEVQDSPKPVRKLIKPIAAFQVSTDDSDSYFSETDDDSRQTTPDRGSYDDISWKKAVTRDLAKQTSIPSREVVRRHTISACDTKNGKKVSARSQHASVLEEDEADSMTGSALDADLASRPQTKSKLVSYRQKHRDVVNVHASYDVSSQNISTSQHCVNSRRRSPIMHAGHCMLSKSQGNLIDSAVSVHDIDLHEVSSVPSECRRLSRSVSVASITDPHRCQSPVRRSQSPQMFAGRSESPVRHLTRSDTFTCSIPRKSQACILNESHVSSRCDSPQTRAMHRSTEVIPARCKSPIHSQQRTHSPAGGRRHSVQLAHGISARDTQISTDQSHRHYAPHVHASCVVGDSHRGRGRAVHRRASVAGDALVSKHEHCNSPYRSKTCEHTQAQSQARPRYIAKTNIQSSRTNERPTDTGDRNSISSERISQLRHSASDVNVERKKSSASTLQESQSTGSIEGTDNGGLVRRSRPGLVRARSRTEVTNRPKQVSIQEEEEKHFKLIETAAQIEARAEMRTDDKTDVQTVVTKTDGKTAVKSVPAVSRSATDRESMIESIRQAREKAKAEQTAISSKARENTPSLSSDSNKTTDTENDSQADRDSMIYSIRQARAKARTERLASTSMDAESTSSESSNMTDTESVAPADRDSVIDSIRQARAKAKAERVVSTADTNTVVPADNNQSNQENENIRRDTRLLRQSAIRSERSEVKLKEQSKTEAVKEPVRPVREINRSRRVAIVARTSPVMAERRASTGTSDSTDVSNTKPNNANDKNDTQEVTSSSMSSKQEVTSSLPGDRHRHVFRQVRPVIRSRSEVRPRSELKPMKGSHNLPVDLENNSLMDSVDKLVIIPPPEFRDPVDVSFDMSPEKVNPDLATDDDIDHSVGDIPDVIKTSRAEFKVADLLHVSVVCETSPVDESPDTNTSNSSNPDFNIPSSHKWQNPIECLSLTLEEVTHIRTVLTKAELESLSTKPDLHAQISKGKICFTCKKTKFALFGQWGTRCKFCQRTVCNYCLRKMNVPTEHFEKIPVYTLSPVPLSPEVLDALKVYESTGSVPHSPNFERKNTNTTSKTMETEHKTTDSLSSTMEADDTRLAAKRKSLQRSHTIGVGGSRPPPNRALLKGPQMSICCDCKSMIMEIIRASRSSVSFLSGPSATPKNENQDAQKPTVQAAGSVKLRPRRLAGENDTRPRSMLASFNFKSFQMPKFGSEA